MNTTSTRYTKAYRITLMAMLIAILIILGYVNIPQPMGLSITFNMIPVAIAAIAMGVPGGLTIGGAFGIISFLQCYGILGNSPLGAALVGYSPVLMFVQRVLSRLLVGLIVGFISKGLKKTNISISKKGALTGFCAAFFNTLFFMSLLVLFFGRTPEMQEKFSEHGGILAYILTATGINAIVEMIVATVVTSAVATALKAAKRIF